MGNASGNRDQIGIKVAVVGAGYWGKNLVRNFADLGALAAVCDSDSDRLGAFAQQYPGAKLLHAF